MSATAEGEPSDSSSPVISMTGGERVLTLADAFNPGDWREGSYTPAGKSQAAQAMMAELSCNTSEPTTLELRFAETTGTLTADVAQDMASPSAHGVVEFSILADGRQVTTKNIKFKDSTQVQVTLSGVAVVEINAKRSDDSCVSDVANALITRLVVAS